MLVFSALSFFEQIKFHLLYVVIFPYSNTRGTSRERALLMLFERYYMAVNEIHFPIPKGNQIERFSRNVFCKVLFTLILNLFNILQDFTHFLYLWDFVALRKGNIYFLNFQLSIIFFLLFQHSAVFSVFFLFPACENSLRFFLSLDCLFSMLVIKYSAWRQNSCFVFSMVGSLYVYKYLHPYATNRQNFRLQQNKIKLKAEIK